jgi:hypothetical protein
VTRYRYVAGFWLSVLATAWALSSIGAGLNAIASNPGKWANDVMIPALVLLAGLAALFIRLSLRLRRRVGYFAKDP